MPPKALKRRSVTLLDVNQSDLVNHLATLLKKTGRLKVPDNIDAIKTASFKELAPFDPNWFYMRCAAILRHIYIRAPVGVTTLTKIFGGRNRKGHCVPAHFSKASSTVLRKALQALEELNLIEKAPGNRGRRLTPQGRTDIDKAAAEVKAMLKKKSQNVLVLD